MKKIQRSSVSRMDKGEYIHMEFCMVPKKIAIATPNSVGESHYRMEKEYKRIYSV